MPVMSQGETTLLTVKVLLASFCWGFGISGLFFGLLKDNLKFGLWCLALDLVCTAVIWFINAYKKDKLSNYSSALFRFMKYISAVLTLGSWVASIIYIYLGADNKQDFDYYSFYSTGLLTTVVGIWFLVLVFDAMKYERLTPS